MPRLPKPDKVLRNLAHMLGDDHPVLGHVETANDGKLPVTGGLRVRVYPLLSRAVDEGVTYGYRRAHKHTGTPSEEELCGAIADAVMSELCELFDFNETPSDD